MATRKKKVTKKKRVRRPRNETTVKHTSQIQVTRKEGTYHQTYKVSVSAKEIEVEAPCGDSQFFDKVTAIAIADAVKELAEQL